MMFLGRRWQFFQLTCFTALASVFFFVRAPALHAQSAMQRELAEGVRRANVERYNSSAAIEQRAQEHHDSWVRMRDAMRGYSDRVASSDAKDPLSLWAQEIQAGIEKEAAKLRAAQEALDTKRRAEEEAQQAIYRANYEMAKAAREKAEAKQISQLTYWQLNHDDHSSAYNLCLVYLGIHRDYQVGPDFKDLKEARRLLGACVEENDPMVLALVWDSIVAKGPHAKLFKDQQLDSHLTLVLLDKGYLPPVGDLLSGDWLRASLSDRVLAVPQLKHLHALALRCWQREVSLMIVKHPADAVRIFKVMGPRLPFLLMSQLSAEVTGVESTHVVNCLMAYAIVRSQHDRFPGDADLTLRAVALGEKLNSPFLLHKLYSLTDDPRRWPALRAALTEKAPSAECLRAALSLASQDPELIRLREADPDLLSEQATVRGISQYAMMLASLNEPFAEGENNTPLAGTLADLAARSLFHKELTAAIPLLVDKARKAHCEDLATQLGLVEVGLNIRQGKLNQADLPRLHRLALQKVPVDKLGYDELLGFTPSQAATCLQAPQTRETLLELMRALSGYGSWKATEALRLAGDHSMESSDFGPKPSALPL